MIAIIILIVIIVVAVKYFSSREKDDEFNETFQQATQGDPVAQYRLGYYYFTDIQDIDQAVYWVCLSETNGYEAATFFLQKMIEGGVPRIYERIDAAREKIRNGM